MVKALDDFAQMCTRAGRACRVIFQMVESGYDKPLSFFIYRNPSSNRQQRKEADEIWWFLNSLCQLIAIEDVEYGPEPPDFVFKGANSSIGVELTKLNPKLFPVGGYSRRQVFNEWEKETEISPQPYREFPWGRFSVRESLASFRCQFEEKCEKVKAWKEDFSEKWLLGHVDRGSPFGEIFPAREQINPGCEENCANYKAKIIYSLATICEKRHPFDYVILFSGPHLFPFPANGSNPHKLPFVKPEVLERGAEASNEFLDWGGELKTCKKLVRPTIDRL